MNTGKGRNHAYYGTSLTQVQQDLRGGPLSVITVPKSIVPESTGEETPLFQFPITNGHYCYFSHVFITKPQILNKHYDRENCSFIKIKKITKKVTEIKQKGNIVWYVIAFQSFLILQLNAHTNLYNIDLP